VEVWRKVLATQVGKDDGFLFQFVGMLIREVRILWQVASGETPVKGASPYMLRGKEATARRLGLARLTRILDLALEADLGVKTGERSPEQSLELLVAGLGQVFGAGDSAPGRR